MAQLKFYKLSAETMANKTVEAGAIWFNKTLKTIEVYNGTSWEKFAGSLQDATWANDKLTIKKYDGSSVELDFSDVASTSSVVTALSNLKTELLGTAEDTADKVTIYGVKAYAKAQAEAAQSAAEGYADNAAAAAKSGAIDAVVGTAADTKEHKTIEGVKKYVDEKTADIASNSEFSTLKDRVDTIEGDYLKNADKEALQGAINTEKGRVDAIENDYLQAADKTELANSIKAISDDYLKAADKTELSGAIKANEDAIKVLEGNDKGKSAREIVQDEVVNQLKSENISESFDTLKEMAEYLSSHPQSVTDMNEAIKANADDIKDLEENVIPTLATNEALNGVDGRLQTAEAAVATVDNRIESAIADEVTRANGAYDAAGAAAAVKEELTDVITENERVTAEGLTDLDTRLKSIEGAVNTESSVAEQISAAVTPVANRVTDLETAVNTTIPGQIAALDAAAVKSVSGKDYVVVNNEDPQNPVISVTTGAVADGGDVLTTATSVKSYVDSELASELASALAWVEFE